MSDKYDLSSVVPDVVTQAHLDEHALNVTEIDSPEQQRWAYSHLMSRSFGIKDFDGRQINNMKPMDDPWQALKRVREAISKSTIDPLVDDDYKALRAATTFDDKLKLAQSRTDWWKCSAVPAIKDAVNGDRLSQDDLAFLETDLSDEDRALIARTQKIERGRRLRGLHHDRISPSHLRTDDELDEAGRERLKELRDVARDRRVVAEYEAKVMQQNAWIPVAAVKRLGKDLRPIISEAGRTVLEYAETHEGDLDGYEDLFLGLDPDERGMLSPIIHMLKPNRDDTWLVGDAARAFWDQAVGVLANALRAVEGVVVRSVVDGESYQALREAEADLRLANQDKMREWGFFGDAIIGAVGTLPYIGYAMVP